VVGVVRSVGVLGGTFDPPHIGHRAMITEALHALRLDEVRVVVAGDPWQKSAHGSITPAIDRLAMARVAFGDHDRVVVDECEVRRGGPSYLVDTLTELSGADVRLVVLLGADAARGLTTWHRWPSLGDLADFAVLDRAGVTADAPDPTWRWHRVDLVRLDVSSSMIRNRVASGEPIDPYVASGVSDLIVARGLYRTSVGV
jgi:nicotinate-nucleotide adenylyltransferase